MAGIGRGKQGKSVEEFLRSQSYEPVQGREPRLMNGRPPGNPEGGCLPRR